MGLIRAVRVSIIFFSLLVALVPLGAQSSYLIPEIERLEKLAIIPGQKREALLNLARLYQLSGNREKALESWNAAAYAEPGKRDDNALIEAIKLWISMGEYDRAGADLRALILSSQDEKIQQSALYLSAQLHAFRTRDGIPLSHFAEVPGYRSVQSKIYYTLWRITEDALWKTRLLNAFPRSPEAEIARGNAAITAAATPQWLLFPPRENLRIVSTDNVSASAADLASTTMLQTGLFSRVDYARALIDNLAKAGFPSEISRRSVNGEEYWAVNVSPGADINQTIRELKNAGFESFPVNVN